MEFKPFDLGNVLARGEQIITSRNARDPNSPQNQLVRAQLQNAQTKAQQDKQTLDQQTQLRNTRLLFQATSNIAQNPASADQWVGRLKSYGIVDPGFDHTAMAPEALQQSAMELSQRLGAELQALDPQKPISVSQGGELRDPYTMNVVARGPQKPETGQLYPVVGPGGTAQYVPRDQAIGRQPQNAPILQIGGEQPKGIIPQGAPAPWQNVRDPKKADDARIRFGANVDAQLNKEAEVVSAAQGMKRDLERFVFLNENVATGPVVGSGFASAARQFLGNEELQEMQSIVSRITPQMRQGLPGSSSDRDVQMFREGTVGVNRDRAVNENIARGMITAAENLEARLAFRQEYAATYGHLRGADKVWKDYLEANPIFDPKADKGSYKLNQNRQTWQQFFGGGGELTPEQRADLMRLRKLQGAGQ